MTHADRNEGTRPGPSSNEQAENRELRKRVRLEQENEVLRRAAYLSQASLPGK